MSKGNLGEYQQLDVLGKGAYGMAYLVKCRESGAKEVMKTINLKDCDEKEKEKAMAEVKMLQKCQHKYIVKLKDSFTENGSIHIVMGYANNGDLQEQIADRKKTQNYFKEEEIIRYFIQICLALRLVH